MNVLLTVLVLTTWGGGRLLHTIQRGGTVFQGRAPLAILLRLQCTRHLDLTPQLLHCLNRHWIAEVKLIALVP